MRFSPIYVVAANANQPPVTNMPKTTKKYAVMPYTELGSTLYIVNLRSGAVRTTTAPPLFAFHHVNAYEDDASDVIVMDVCTLNPEHLGKPVHAIIKSIFC